MHAKSLQSCPTLCNLMDYSLPGSSVHGGDAPGKNTASGLPSPSPIKYVSKFNFSILNFKTISQNGLLRF